LIGLSEFAEKYISDDCTWISKIRSTNNEFIDFGKCLPVNGYTLELLMAIEAVPIKHYGSFLKSHEC
jgi:hypothetical protein